MDFERINPLTNRPASKAQAMTLEEAIVLSQAT